MIRWLIFGLLLSLPAAAFAQVRSEGTTVSETTAASAAPAEPEYPVNLEKLGVTLPTTQDAELQRVLRDPQTIFYKLKSAWQHYIPPSRVEHVNTTLGMRSYSIQDMKWGVFYSTFSADFNANPLFPWDTTAGLNETRKKTNELYFTVNFINLPKHAKGSVVPILVVNERPLKWIFPDDTTVGEIIYVRYENQRYVQEIRTRKKSPGALEWQPHLYRPVATREEFRRLANLPEYTPAKRYVFLRNPQEDEVFKMEGLVERLPPISTNTVKQLLAQPFKDVSDDLWSPSADQDFHILPRNYCFSLLQSVDAETCANCHRQTQISVLNLVPKEPDIVNNPEKIGNIRGSDSVFTWHPFTYSSIREDDTTPQPEVRLRAYDTSNGIIQLWTSPMSSLPANYRLTKFVQDSLKNYELPHSTFLHPNSATTDTKVLSNDASITPAAAR